MYLVNLTQQSQVSRSWKTVNPNHDNYPIQIKEVYVLQPVRYKTVTTILNNEYAHNFIVLTTLQHTCSYMFQDSLAHRQGAHDCTKQ
jgi:spermidine/putrescine-binding protein